MRKPTLIIVPILIVTAFAKDVMLMNRIGPSVSDLYVANADGTAEHKLLASPGFDYHASYSNDGSWIVFTSERVGYGQADIYRVHSDGTGLERLTDDPALDDQAVFSADGSEIAFVSTRGTTHRANVWILNLKTRSVRNLTGGTEIQGDPLKPDGFFRPAWSPDGGQVAFVRDSGSGGDIYVRPVNGAGQERLLLHLDRPLQEVVWSPDGQWIVVRTETGVAGSGDLLGIRTSGDHIPVPLVSTSFTEMHPAISPDGRWLAYTSNEAGANQVYVRPFPDTRGGQWQISNGGGRSPVWSRDGKALYFLDATGHVVEAEIRPGAGASVEVPRLQTLFDASSYALNPYHQEFEITPDGHFLMLGVPKGAGQQVTRLVEVDNWFADLKAKLAGQ